MAPASLRIRLRCRQSWHYGRLLDLSCRRRLDADAVLIERGGKQLLQRRAILGVGRRCRDQVVLSHCQISSLLKHVRGGRRSQPVLLLLRVQALCCEIPCRLGCAYLGAVVRQGILRVDHLDPDLCIQLLQPHLRLAILHLRPRLVRLRRSVADRDRNIHANTLVRRAIVEQVLESRVITDGRVKSGRILLARAEVDCVRVFARRRVRSHRKTHRRRRWAIGRSFPP